MNDEINDYDTLWNRAHKQRKGLGWVRFRGGSAI